MSSRAQLQEFVNEVRLIDTHEHMFDEAERLAQPCDPFAFFFSHYASTDAMNAGLSLAELLTVRDPALPLQERWPLLRRVWPCVRTTGYGRMLLYAMRDLYGVDDLADETIETLAARMRERHAPGLHHWVLREQAGIDLYIRTSAADYPARDPGSVNAINLVELIMLNTLDQLETLGERMGVAVHRLRDLEEVIERQMAAYLQPDIVAVKVPVAYQRSLHFAHVTAHEAEEALQFLFRTEYRTPLWSSSDQHSFAELRPLQDYIMHRIVQCAAALDIPIQVHTGLLEGFGNTIANSNPALLNNLFIEYPRAKFAIFHLGYPYTDELAALAKMFPNVYVDFCWNHIIHPALARRVLGEMVDSLAANKLLAFGGDHLYAEGAYGHQLIARRNVAAALAEKVDDGFYTRADAEFLATRLLRENAIDLFKLERVMATA